MYESILTTCHSNKYMDNIWVCENLQVTLIFFFHKSISCEEVFITKPCTVPFPKCKRIFKPNGNLEVVVSGLFFNVASYRQMVVCLWRWNYMIGI